MTTSINGASFMMNLALSTINIAGTVVTNIGLLKGINIISSIGMSTISYIQGLGVDSNEAKECKPDEEKLGKRLSERAFKAILLDLKDMPKVALVIAIGLGAMWAARSLGGQILLNTIKPFVFSQPVG